MNRNSSLKALLSLVWPYKGSFVLAMIALSLGAGINLLFPELLRRLLNQENIHYLVDAPVPVALILVGLFAFQGICFYFRTYLFGIIGTRAVKDLQQRLYTNVIQQNIDFFDRQRVGDLLSRITADTQMVREAVSIKLSVFIRYSIQIIGGIILMLTISVRLTVVLALILPVIIGLSMILGKKLKKLSKEQQKELARASTIAEETISGVRIVHAFNQIKREIDRFQSAIQKLQAVSFQRVGVAAFFSSFVSFLMNAAIVGVLLYGSTLISEKLLTPGDLAAFFLYGVIVAVSFAFVAGGMGEFATALGATETLFELLSSPRQEGLVESENLKAQKNLLDVNFRNVSFAYPSRPDHLALDDVSFHVEAGTTLALVGPSGAGKSTIAQLLLGFYSPQAGEISLSGKNISTLSPYALRQYIGFVPQDPQLFAVSIAENLRYGNAQATEAELNEALQKANALDFVRALPEGINTYVGERGVQLSGGQKQRIAIARAILRDPSLLILDEATSALDSENEHLIQEALKELMKERTSLVIAHRLSTIQNAHQVVVLEQGRVIQVGTHSELSLQTGLYRALVEKQELSDGNRA